MFFGVVSSPLCVCIPFLSFLPWDKRWGNRWNDKCWVWVENICGVLASVLSCPARRSQWWNSWLWSCWVLRSAKGPESGRSVPLDQGITHHPFFPVALWLKALGNYTAWRSLVLTRCHLSPNNRNILAVLKQFGKKKMHFKDMLEGHNCIQTI